MYRKIRNVHGYRSFSRQLIESPLLLHVHPADTVSDLSSEYHTELSRLVEFLKKVNGIITSAHTLVYRGDYIAEVEAPQV